MRLVITRNKNGAVIAESVEPPHARKVPAVPVGKLRAKPRRTLDEALTVEPEGPDPTRKRMVVEDTHEEVPQPTRKRIVRDPVTGEVTVEGGTGPHAREGFDDHIDDPLADDEVFGDDGELRDENELRDLFGEETRDTEVADVPDDNADVVAMERAAEEAVHEEATVEAEKAAPEAAEAQVSAAKEAKKREEAKKNKAEAERVDEADAQPKHACDQCDFVAATGSGLASHKAAKHEA